MLSRPGRSGGDEPGVETIGGCVHKQRTLNTRLSYGTSAGTFAVSAGPYRNYRNEAGTKIEPDMYFVPVQTKGWKIDPHVSNLRSREFKFSRGSGPPLTWPNIQKEHNVYRPFWTGRTVTACGSSCHLETNSRGPHDSVAPLIVSAPASVRNRGENFSQDRVDGSFTKLNL